jgi:O-acetylhomoserine (thiol)-lyase
MFRPFEHGIDIAVYSTTKLLGGHGLHVGGAVVDSGKFRWSDHPKKWPEFCAPSEAYHGVVFADAVGELAYIIQMRCQWLRDTGAAMSPFAAFLFMIGIETLHLRAERHAQNAQAVAEFLDAHECVAWVNYPGLKNHPHYANAQKYLPNGKGAIIGFGIKGGKAAGVKFINNVQLAKHLANILDAKTLVIHPASTTHQQLTAEEQTAAGVSEEYIRLSVGIEDLSDIQADLDQALRASQKK